MQILNCILGIFFSMALFILCLFEGTFIITVCASFFVLSTLFFMWLLIIVAKTPIKEFHNDTVRKNIEL